MKKFICLGLSLILLLSAFSFNALATNNINDFVFLGDASMLEDSTVQLTPLDYWKVGGAWYRNKVNSTNGIKIEFSY